MFLEHPVGRILREKADVIITIYNPNKQFKNNHMLQVQSIKLKQDILLVEEMEVVISETHNGVMKDTVTIEREKASRVMRFGTIISTGDLLEETLNASSFKGKQKKDLIGKVVMYTVHGVHLVLDTAVENLKRPVFLNLAYVEAEIIEEPITLETSK